MKIRTAHILESWIVQTPAKYFSCGHRWPPTFFKCSKQCIGAILWLGRGQAQTLCMIYDISSKAATIMTFGIHGGLSNYQYERCFLFQSEYLRLLTSDVPSSSRAWFSEPNPKGSKFQDFHLIIFPDAASTCAGAGQTFNSRWKPLPEPPGMK